MLIFRRIDENKIEHIFAKTFSERVVMHAED